MFIALNIAAGILLAAWVIVFLWAFFTERI